MYSTWSDFLPSEVSVSPIQLPGHGDRLTEDPHLAMGALVEELAADLRPLLDRPFALFGHSLGALVCFELARQLRRNGAPAPVGLFVSGRAAPQISDGNDEGGALSDAEIVAEIRRLGGTPEAVLQSQELMQILLPALRADFLMYRTYRYAAERPLACPIRAFGGMEDEGATPWDLAAWREQTEATFSYRLFPGGHFFLHERRREFLGVLAEGLLQVRGAASA